MERHHRKWISSFLHIPYKLGSICFGGNHLPPDPTVWKPRNIKFSGKYALVYRNLLLWPGNDFTILFSLQIISGNEPHTHRERERAREREREQTKPSSDPPPQPIVGAHEPSTSPAPQIDKPTSLWLRLRATNQSSTSLANPEPRSPPKTDPPKIASPQTNHTPPRSHHHRSLFLALSVWPNGGFDRMVLLWFLFF